MAGGPWFQPVYAQCEALKASLRDGVPSGALDPEYREFFDYSQSLNQAWDARLNQSPAPP
jgi:hypothetical protein